MKCKIAIKVSEACPCDLSVFVVNGVMASRNDFLDLYYKPTLKEEKEYEKNNIYGGCCGIRWREVNKGQIKETLKKYDISLSDYKEICKALKNKLVHGICCMCE